MRLLFVLFLPAAIYQLLAITAAFRHLVRRRRDNQHTHPPFLPPVSVLKPLRGLDPAMSEAFLSQVEQNYPEFEVLFGVRDPDDPAIAEVKRLQSKHPECRIRLICGTGAAANRKVGVLIELAKHACHPVWVVNDSDIRVTPDYLRRVIAPLHDPAIGIVTCLYRPRPHTFAAQWEALGIATDFMPSVLVAPLVGVKEFGLGSTLAFRAADLVAIGGFDALADYLADDYQLAKKISSLGKRAFLSTYPVETSLGDTTWAGVWQHQLRWARTIRLSQGSGYAGLPITHAGLWALFAALAGFWPMTVFLLILRITSAFLTGAWVLESTSIARFAWLSPLWDLYAFILWLACYRSRAVRWRDRELTMDHTGRIVKTGTGA